MNELNRALSPVRRRLRVVRLVSAFPFAAIFLGVWLLVTRTIAMFMPVEHFWEALAPSWIAAGMGLLATYLWPVSARRAAMAADGGGLLQRAVTALENHAEDTPMACLQRADALKALRGLDAKKALPFRKSRKALVAACALLAACGVLMAVPNPQDELLRGRAELREEANARAEEIEKAAEELAKSADPDGAALQKIAKTLSAGLRDANDLREALLALNDAQDQIARIEKSRSSVLRQSAAEALRAGGLDSLADAAENGDEKDFQRAAEALEAESASAQSDGDEEDALSKALSQAASAMGDSSALQSALQNAASSMPGAARQAALNQLAGKLNPATGSSAAGKFGALAASAKASLAKTGGGSVSASGSSSSMKEGSGSGGSGGAGSGLGKGASGAGSGTTNQDGGRTPGMSNSSGSGVSRQKVKIGAYESIYDPTRLGDGGEATSSTGKVNEGDETQYELSPAEGVSDGSVPFASGAYAYADAAAKAASESGAPAEVRKLVNDYFSALIDESEGS